MKKTLLNSALTGTAGALALTVMLGTGAAFASNEAEAGDDQIAVQDVLNGSLNGNGDQRNNDSSTNVDDSLNNNNLQSNNDNDQLDLDVDAELENIANDYSSTDSSTSVDADLDNIGNSYSARYEDNSTSIEDVAVLVSTQTLVGTAAKSVGGGLVYMDDVETGDIDLDDGFKMAAGSVTSSANTGLSSNAQAATAILANGDFRID